LYDIRPGNGAGLFLQPWSPHGAKMERMKNQEQWLRRRVRFDGDWSFMHVTAPIKSGMETFWYQINRTVLENNR